MPKKVKIAIKVTQDDIDRGEPGNVCYCPIALAFKRAYEGTYWLENVGVLYLNFRLSAALVGVRMSIALPENAIRFIHEFDEHTKDLKPFEFEANAFIDSLAGRL